MEGLGVKRWARRLSGKEGEIHDAPSGMQKEGCRGQDVVCGRSGMLWLLLCEDARAGGVLKDSKTPMASSRGARNRTRMDWGVTKSIWDLMFGNGCFAVFLGSDGFVE
eukprot:15828-Rhodomonas_salina.1